MEFIEYPKCIYFNAEKTKWVTVHNRDEEDAEFSKFEAETKSIVDAVGPKIVKAEEKPVVAPEVKKPEVKADAKPQGRQGAKPIKQVLVTPSREPDCKDC